MNGDLFKARWQEFKGKVKSKWNKLSDMEIAQINGKREQLLVKLQQKYNWDERHAEEELRRFEDSLMKEHQREMPERRQSGQMEGQMRGREQSGQSRGREQPGQSRGREQQKPKGPGFEERRRKAG
jgi:uncharacterized protein YjbJ (UPF0337 family)